MNNIYYKNKYNISSTKFKDIIVKISKNEPINNNYYEIKHICNDLKINQLCNTIWEINDVLLNIIKTIVNDLQNTISINIYLQLFREYNQFHKKIFFTFDKFIPQLKYHLFKKNIYSFNFTTLYSKSDGVYMYDNLINKFNDKIPIDIIIEFINNMELFSIYHNKMNKIVNTEGIINNICKYIHNTLTTLKYKCLENPNHTNIYPEKIKDNILKKLYKFIDIIVKYANKKELINHYQKYLQVRLLNLTYDNLDVELIIINKFKFCTELINMKNLISNIHNIKNNNICKPILINKQNLKHVNIPYYFNVNFPDEISQCLNTIEKQYCNNNIKWIPTWGTMVLNASFRKQITITCYLLQGIILIYMNKYSSISESTLSKLTNINASLISKVTDSLVDSGLLAYDKKPNYVINKDRYFGAQKIDIRKSFIEAFEED